MSDHEQLSQQIEKPTTPMRRQEDLHRAFTHPTQVWDLFGICKLTDFFQPLPFFFSRRPTARIFLFVQCDRIMLPLFTFETPAQILHTISEKKWYRICLAVEACCLVGMQQFLIKNRSEIDCLQQLCTI